MNLFLSQSVLCMLQAAAEPSMNIQSWIFISFCCLIHKIIKIFFISTITQLLMNLLDK